MAADARTLYSLLGLLFIIASAQDADPNSCASIPYCLETEADGKQVWCDRSTGGCPPCLYRIENRDDRFSCFDKANGATTCPYSGAHTDCEKRNTPTEKPTPVPTEAPATPAPTEEKDDVVLPSPTTVTPSPTIGNTKSEVASSGGVFSNLETYQIGLIGAGCLIAIIAAALFGYLGYKPPDDRESDFEKHFHSIASASTGRSDSFDLESGEYIMSESEDESLNSDDDYISRGSQESSFLDEVNSRRRNKITTSRKTSPKKVVKKKKKKVVVSDDESEAGLQFGGSESSWGSSIPDEPSSPMLSKKKKGKKPTRYSISLSDDDTKPKGKTAKKKKKGAAVKKTLVDKKRNKKKQIEI